MGYNDSKEWIDEQADNVKMLVEIVRVGGVSEVVFDNSRDALYYQQYISNIRRGLQIHYPQYSDVALAVRTWRVNDYDNGKFVVYVGIPAGNYNKPRQGKSSRSRRLPPPTAQGRPPVPLRAGLSSAPAYGKQWSEATTIPTDDINEVDVLMDNTDFVLALVSGAEITTTKQLVFKATKLTTQAVQVMMEQIPHWTVEDSTVDEVGIVTTLTLRRMEVAQ